MAVLIMCAGETMTEDLICKNCGSGNGPELSSCHFCGNPLDDFVDEPEQILILDLETTSVAKKAVSFVNIFVGLFIAVIVLAIFIPMTGRSGSRVRARVRACMANMRVLQGAVEMYNMDNQKMISEFDENTLELLVSGKYLKSRPICPGSPSGVYRSNGDLTKEGVISCSVHGTVENPVEQD